MLEKLKSFVNRVRRLNPNTWRFNFFKENNNSKGNGLGRLESVNDSDKYSNKDERGSDAHSLCQAPAGACECNDRSKRGFSSKAQETARDLMSPAVLSKDEKCTLDPFGLEHNVLKKMDENGAELKGLIENVRSSLMEEIQNSTRQLEAYLQIREFLSSGILEPEWHGWSISPDFGLLIIRLMDTNKYDLVLEFGSGSSTVLIGQALNKIRKKRGTDEPIQIAFEHLERYYWRTLVELKKEGVNSDLIFSALTDYTDKEGRIYQYYNIESTLKALRARYQSESIRILMVVDGPPESTGQYARYPAVPQILNFFKGANIDVLLDDYRRDDERKVVDMWIADFEMAGYVCSLEAKGLEKGAALIVAEYKNLNSNAMVSEKNIKSDAAD